MMQADIIKDYPLVMMKGWEYYLRRVRVDEILKFPPVGFLCVHQITTELKVNLLGGCGGGGSERNGTY